MESALLDRFQMMRDHDGGSAFHQSVERLEHQLFGRRVEPRGRFIEDQDRRVADDGAGDGDALALAAGERHAALADHRVVAFRHPLDEFVRVGEPGRADDLIAGGFGFAVGDVLPDRRVEENRLLQDETDLLAQRSQSELAHVLSVDHDPRPTMGRRSAG